VVSTQARRLDASQAAERQAPPPQQRRRRKSRKNNSVPRGWTGIAAVKDQSSGPEDLRPLPCTGLSETSGQCSKEKRETAFAHPSTEYGTQSTEQSTAMQLVQQFASDTFVSCGLLFLNECAIIAAVHGSGVLSVPVNPPHPLSTRPGHPSVHHPSLVPPPEHTAPCPFRSAQASHNTRIQGGKGVPSPLNIMLMLELPCRGSSNLVCGMNCGNPQGVTGQCTP